MASSTAPAAKAQIITTLGARSGLNGVNIDWAAPNKTEDYTGGDNIWLGDVEESQEYNQVGAAPLPRDEEYTIALVAQTHRDGNDPKATEQRAWALLAEVEAALRSDPNLSGALNMPGWCGITGIRMSTRPAEPQGWLAKATCEITCQARI